MWNKLKRKILDLLGIEAILPKGAAYLLFTGDAQIKFNGPVIVSGSGLIMKNVRFDANHDHTEHIMSSNLKPTPAHDPFGIPDTLP